MVDIESLGVYCQKIVIDTNEGKGKEDVEIHEIQLVRVPISGSLLIPGENKISIICEK